MGMGLERRGCPTAQGRARLVGVPPAQPCYEIHYYRPNSFSLLSFSHILSHKLGHYHRTIWVHIDTPRCKRGFHNATLPGAPTLNNTQQPKAFIYGLVSQPFFFCCKSPLKWLKMRKLCCGVSTDLLPQHITHQVSPLNMQGDI